LSISDRLFRRRGLGRDPATSGGLAEAKAESRAESGGEELTSLSIRRFVLFHNIVLETRISGCLAWWEAKVLNPSHPKY
jgi:hypothetical protein